MDLSSCSYWLDLNTIIPRKATASFLDHDEQVDDICNDNVLDDNKKRGLFKRENVTNLNFYECIRPEGSHVFIRSFTIARVTTAVGIFD